PRGIGEQVILWACGHEFDPETEYRHYCKGAYMIQPPILRKPGERIPDWQCQCRRPDGTRLLRNHRHTWPPQCIPQEAVDAFIVRTGCNKAFARYALWMEEEFSR